MIDGLQPYLDKMKIVFKEHCKKRDMDGRHYGIKIGEEVFNYYGSNKDYTDEMRCISSAIHQYGKQNRFKRVDYTNDKLATMGAKFLKIELPTTDKILTDALYALIQDYRTFEDYTMEDFIDEFGYKCMQGIKVWKELEINHYRMQNVFTTDELNKLRNMFQDY